MAPHLPVHLTLPAEPGSVRLARLVAAGVAADAGLSIDDTEDLRIAVSELVALLIEGSDDPSLRAEVTYERSEGWVAVTGKVHVTAPTAPEVPTDDLALEILRVVVDEHELDVDGDTRRFRLVKRARTTT